MMKRIIYCLFATLIFISLIIANHNIGNSETSRNNDEMIDVERENVTPNDSTTYSFESYADIFDTLVNAASKRNEKMQSEEKQYGKLYYATRSAFLSKTLGLLVPTIDGIEMELRNKEGFSNITLMTNEAYNIPWIWYHCLYNDEDVRVEIAYPSVMSNENLKKENSIIEILNIIAPDAPMPSNYLSDPRWEDYKNVYTKDITLSDSDIVLALVYEFEDCEEIYVLFVIDSALVSLYAKNDILSEDFWQRFSVREYSWCSDIFIFRQGAVALT